MNYCTCGHSFTDKEATTKTTPHLNDKTKAHINYFCPKCGLIHQSLCKEIDAKEANIDHKIALLDAGYTIQAEITRLERGLPIAESKARTGAKQVQTRKEYNMKIKTLREQLKAINAAIYA